MLVLLHHYLRVISLFKCIPLNVFAKAEFLCYFFHTLQYLYVYVLHPMILSLHHTIVSGTSHTDKQSSSLSEDIVSW